MNRIIFLISLGVLASFQACECQEDGSKFFVELPSEEQFNNPFHKTVRDALLKLDVSQRAINVVLTEAAQNEKLDPTYRQVYKTILTVTKFGDKCTNQLVEVYKSVWAQSIAKTPKLSPFHRFMRFSDPQRFKLCSRRVNRNFVMQPFEVSAEKDFYTVLRETFGLEENSEPQKLLHSLMNFSISYNKFNAKRMVEAAKKVESDSTKYMEDEYSFLRYFWLSRCEQFDVDPVSRMLDIVGLSRSVTFDYREYDARLLLLTEYRRICYEWLHPYTSEDATMDRVEANVRRSIGMTWKQMMETFAT